MSQHQQNPHKTYPPLVIELLKSKLISVVKMTRMFLNFLNEEDVVDQNICTIKNIFNSLCLILRGICDKRVPGVHPPIGLLNDAGEE